MSFPDAHFDHFSLTVADLDRSARFYQRFGYEPGRRYTASGSDVEAGTGTPGARLKIMLLHRRDGGPSLELIEYLDGGTPGATNNSSVGSAHLCFAVPNLASALANLGGAGISAISAPHTDSSGSSWVYLRDPDGNAVELISPGS